MAKGTFAKEFPDIQVVSPGRGLSPLRGADIRRDNAYKEALRRAQKQGWEKATIVNLHGFPLDHPMGRMGHVKVPAKKGTEPYAKSVIYLPRFDAKDRGDENYEYIMISPMEIADDVVEHYGYTGGVFAYTGDGDVPMDKLEAALDAQRVWYLALYEEAQIAWARSKNPRDISGPMRDAARALFQQKLIPFAPDWLTTTRADSPDWPCEGCGQIIPKVAKFCFHCNTIYDPEWVRSRRPDLWRAQNPDPMDVGEPTLVGPKKGK